MSDANNDDFSELQAFVAGSLKAIMEGISEAQSSAQLPSPFGTGTHAYNAPKEVGFDIAVTAERTSSAKGGFSLKVLSVGAGAEAKGDRAHSTATRIQFSVRTEFRSKNAGQPVNIPSTRTVV
jgi:hypothetical protein